MVEAVWSAGSQAAHSWGGTAEAAVQQASPLLLGHPAALHTAQTAEAACTLAYTDSWPKACPRAMAATTESTGAITHLASIDVSHDTNVPAGQGNLRDESDSTTMRNIGTPVHGMLCNSCCPAGMRYMSTFKIRFKPACSPIRVNWHLPWLPSSSPDL